MGLKHDCNYPFQVYVLLCAGFCYYVGISPVGKLVDRIQNHFSGSGAHYCREHKPQAILLVWPALLESVEALVYFTMQQKLFHGGRGDCGKLGGWVQTSSKRSPLCVMQCEQTRRQLLGKCFVWRRQAFCGLAQLFGRGQQRGPVQVRRLRRLHHDRQPRRVPHQQAQGGGACSSPTRAADGSDGAARAEAAEGADGVGCRARVAERAQAWRRRLRGVTGCAEGGGRRLQEPWPEDQVLQWRP